MLDWPFHHACLTRECFLFFVESDECDSSPCLNNGTCVEQINSYLCGCTEGFTGVNCETGRQITDVCIIMVVLKNAVDSS